MHRSSGLVTVALAASIAAGVVTACLGSIPEASKCPADAVYPPCAPPPAPNPTIDAGPLPACTVALEGCRAARGDCACRPDLECKRTAETCSPPPDCPASITSVVTGATCVDTSATLTPIGPQAPPCVCGCVSCATTCDGQGPVLVGQQVMRFDMPAALPGSGRLSVMARVRGSGRFSVAVRTDIASTTVPLGSAPATPSFTEIVLGTGAPPPFTWSAAAPKPLAIELTADPGSIVEVDCVVPFYAR